MKCRSVFLAMAACAFATLLAAQGAVRVVLAVKSAAIPDVLSGRDLMQGNALSQAKGSKLRGLAVTELKRNPLAPDRPPMAQTLPGYEITAWFVLLAPAGTPPDIVQKLQDATIKALAKPDVKEKLAVIGMNAAPLKSAETGAFIKAEVARWSRLIKEAGIQPE